MYVIKRCPSDNSEEPEVYQRGYSFRPPANDKAFELNGKDDGYDYWPEEVPDAV